MSNKTYSTAEFFLLETALCAGPVRQLQGFCEELRDTWRQGEPVPAAQVGRTDGDIRPISG